MNEAFGMILPGMMYFWVLFVGQTPMQEVLNEKETFTLSRILAAPVTLGQFVLSKMIRCFLLCAVIQEILLALSAVLFGIHWGNPFYLTAVVAVNAWSMTGMLSFIYAAARTREQANILSTVLLLLCAMVGGSMMPFEQLPKFLQIIGQVTPNRWSVLAIHGVTKAKPLGEVLVPVSVLFGMGTAGVVSAYFLFRRQLTGGSGK